MTKISREFVEKGGLRSYSVVTVAASVRSKRCAAMQAVLFGIALMASHPATVASAEPRMSVVYNASRISIEASGVTVAEVLREVGRKVGFSIADAGSSDARLSFSIRDASLPEALEQLLRSENHVLLYRDGIPTIDTVMLLGARVAGASAHLNQPDHIFTHSGNRDQGGVNPPAEIAPPSATPVSGAPPSTPADLGEYRRLAEGSPEVVNASDLLLRHAGSGVAASPATPVSGGASMASSSAISTDASDPGMILATTTRLAQQNLAKLVQALTAATSSMLSSQRERFSALDTVFEMELARTRPPALIVILTRLCLAAVRLARQIVRHLYGSASYLMSFTRRRSSYVRRRWPGALDLEGATRIAVFVHFDPQGIVHDFVLHYLAEIARADFTTVFVSNAPRLDPESRERVFPSAARPCSAPMSAWTSVPTRTESGRCNGSIDSRHSCWQMTASTDRSTIWAT